MCWHVGPANADDEETMPQLTRIFTPNLSAFPANVTNTSLGVDDLAVRCYEVGYAKAESNGRGGGRVPRELRSAFLPAPPVPKATTSTVTAEARMPSKV